MKLVGKIGLSLLAVFCFVQASNQTSNEFVVAKKEKKQTAAQVKEEVVELLESVVRQLGQNIQQAVDTQNRVFDMIKSMISQDQFSTQQLKDKRTMLEQHLKKLEQQQAELYDILLACK